MLRKNLLLTTAFVVAGTLSFLAQFAALAQPATVAPGADKNDEFLCTYGLFPVSHLVSHISGYRSSEWTHVAVPVPGHGQTVDRILVYQERADGYTRWQFSAGIYSNTPSGVPGKLIAGGTANAPKNCGPINISIRPTTLSSKTTYWIEETVPRPYDAVYWAADPKAKHKAYIQHHHYASSSGVIQSSYTSPWTRQSTGPYLRLK